MSCIINLPFSFLARAIVLLTDEKSETMDACTSYKAISKEIKSMPSKSHQFPELPNFLNS